MSNKTDLDWLARNVHVWKSGYDLAVVQRGIEEIYVTWPSACSSGITKKEWLSRRAELQNKPSWDDAPEWARWLAQDSWGCWGWFLYCPIKQPLAWIAINGYYSINSPGAEVLGDWRDTLERRPEQQEEFQPFISIEDNQEQIMGNKQGNSWHERGELPPVGVSCEFIRHDDVHWHDKLTTGSRVKILAHYSPCDDGAMVAVFSFDASGDVETGSEVDQGVGLCFRPIRTEHDQLVDVLNKAGIVSYAHLVADAILAADFRKETK